MATSPRSIGVRWGLVDEIDRNGIITMYEVLYVPMETFDGAIGSLTTNVSDLATPLRDLEEYVNYTIFVRAYTNVGAGPYSDPMRVLTPQDGKILNCSLFYKQ